MQWLKRLPPRLLIALGLAVVIAVGAWLSAHPLRPAAPAAQPAAQPTAAAPPITDSIVVRPSRIHRID